MDFASTIASKGHINPLIASPGGVKPRHVGFHKALDATKIVVKLRREFLASIAEALVPQGMLDLHQIRGAFLAYMKRQAAVFKSAAISGWGA